MHAPGLFDLTDHLARLSATGDPLEALDCHVNFEALRPILVAQCLNTMAEIRCNPDGDRPIPRRY